MTAYTIIIIFHEATHALTAYALRLHPTLFQLWVSYDFERATERERALIGVRDPLSVSQLRNRSSSSVDEAPPIAHPFPFRFGLGWEVLAGFTGGLRMRSTFHVRTTCACRGLSIPIL